MPISKGKKDTGGPGARRNSGLFTPVTPAGVYGHVRVVTLRERKKKKALLPFQPDLPPGIDQKQINFHFQLGIQLNPKCAAGGKLYCFRTACAVGGLDVKPDEMKYNSLCLCI